MKQPSPTLFATCLLLLAACLGCEEPAKPQALDTASNFKVEEPAKPSAPPVERPPTFEIDMSSPKLGYERYLVEHPNDVEKLRTELSAKREFIDGKALSLTVDRQAKLEWVTTYLSLLEAFGATSFAITTDTRGDYPKTVTFSTQAALKQAPSCSVISIIGEDRTTSTWQLSGGKARQRRRGLGGPDLSTTGTTIESVAKGCKGSDTVFVSGHESVNWGLIYDLAASTAVLEKVRFEHWGLLAPTPTPGKRVTL